MNKRIKEILEVVFGDSEIESDWYGLTLYQILREIEKHFPYAHVYWDLFNADELNHVFCE